MVVGGVGGNFNLLCSFDEKKASNIDGPCMHVFNDCIVDLVLRNITSVGSLYIWMNN